MKMIMWKLLNVLYRIVHPCFWVQNHRTSYEYDAKLRELLDSGVEIETKSEQTAIIGSNCVWISNYPYSYGNLYGVSEVLPAPLTRVRLRKIIESSMVK